MWVKLARKRKVIIGVILSVLIAFSNIIVFKKNTMQTDNTDNTFLTVKSRFEDIHFY